MAIEERKLTSEEKAELRAAATDLPELDRDRLPELVADLQAAPSAPDELIFALAVWWAEQIRELTGWVWVHLSLGPGLDAPALVSADRSVALLPLQRVADVVEGRADDDLGLTLDRLASGARPSGPPGSYALV